MSESETELIRRKWSRNRILWAHGLGSAIILGVTHSVTPAIVSPETFNLTTGLKRLLIMIGVSGLIGAFSYLAKSPLPQIPKELEDGDTTTESK